MSSVGEVFRSGANLPEPLTDRQQFVANHLGATVKEVATLVLTILTDAQNVNINSFVKNEILPRQADFVDLDARTQMFFHQMMVAINENIDQNQQLVISFMAFSMYCNDPDLREKFVRGVAIEPVQRLIEKLDMTDCSIIDDMISPQEDVS